MRNVELFIGLFVLAFTLYTGYYMLSNLPSQAQIQTFLKAPK